MQYVFTKFCLNVQICCFSSENSIGRNQIQRPQDVKFNTSLGENIFMSTVIAAQAE